MHIILLLLTLIALFGNDAAWAIRYDPYWSIGWDSVIEGTGVLRIESIAVDEFDGTPLPVHEMPPPNPVRGNPSQYGANIAMTQDTEGGYYMVVGAHLEDVNGMSRAGQAYFWRVDGENKKVLLATDGGPTPENDAYCGWAVAVSAKTAVVGCEGADNGSGNGNGSGRVDVYDFKVVDGVEKAVFRQSIMENDKPVRFGTSLTLDNNGRRLVVGAPNLRNAAGAVYIYDIDNGADNGADLRATILGIAGRWDFPRFGTSVDCFGDRCVVGAPGPRTHPRVAAPRDGGVFVIRNSASRWRWFLKDVWTQEQVIIPGGNWGELLASREGKYATSVGSFSHKKYV